MNAQAVNKQVIKRRGWQMDTDTQRTRQNYRLGRIVGEHRRMEGFGDKERQGGETRKEGQDKSGNKKNRSTRTKATLIHFFSHSFFPWACAAGMWNRSA